MIGSIENTVVCEIADKTNACLRGYGFDVSSLKQNGEESLSFEAANAFYSLDFWVLRRLGAFAQKSLFSIQGKLQLRPATLKKEIHPSVLDSLHLNDLIFEFALRHLLPDECGPGGMVFDCESNLEAEVEEFCKLLCASLHQLIKSFEAGDFFVDAGLMDTKIFGSASDFFAKKVLGAWSLGRAYSEQQFGRDWSLAIEIDRKRFQALAVLHRKSLDEIAEEYMRKTQVQRKALMPFIGAAERV